MQSILSILALCICTSASATTVGLDTFSHHFPSKDFQDNSNFGLYFKLDNGFTAGAYHNTLRRTSVYAGWTWNIAGPVDLTVGLISGYQKKVTGKEWIDGIPTNNPVVVGSAVYQYTTYDHSVISPTYTGYSSAALTPMAMPSVRLPEFKGIVTRLSFIPGVDHSASVLHLSFEKKF